MTNLEKQAIYMHVTAHATVDLAGAWETGDAHYNGAHCMLQAVARALVACGVIDSPQRFVQEIDEVSTTLTVRK